MSDSSLLRSQEFLRVADQFKLGGLVTEASHPVTANLSDLARTDVSGVIGRAFDVDDDVLRVFRAMVEGGRLGAIAAGVVDALRGRGRIFFTGCGSTGRLSVQLVSIWRDFWQREGRADFEARAHAVMSGGDYALIKAVEGFEDFTAFGRKQIADLGVRAGDIVFAITEGGETSFVIGTAWQGVDAEAKVYFVYNNPDDVLRRDVDRSREVIDDPRIEKINLTTGPMAITGSTRLQATSIQLAVLVTVLEMAARALTGRGDPGAAPAESLAELTAIHATLKTAPVREALAGLVATEERVYRAGKRNNYFAHRFAIDVLTDTTERSPTYCTPAFRKAGDDQASESWAYLFVPESDTPRAWRQILKRMPACLEWTVADVHGLVPADRLARTVEVLADVGPAELMRFRVGFDGLPLRPPQAGGSAIAILSEHDTDTARAAIRGELQTARAAGAATGLLMMGRPNAVSVRAEEWRAGDPDLVVATIAVPETTLLLGGAARVGLKMTLNALSIATMVRLGRVMGNFMIWVVPTNLKLIDRATRYVQKLTGLDYEPANHLVFEVLEYVEPRMKADQAYPPVVGVSVMRHRHGLDNAAAESRLVAELAR